MHRIIKFGPLFTLMLTLALALPGQAANAEGPRIEQWTTGGGIEVYFVRNDALPIVDLSLLFDAGSARDGNLPGLASITSSLLSESAAGMDAGAIARRFEDQGARFSASSGRDSASVSLRSLNDPDTLSGAMGALADVIGRPDFPETAVERERRRMQVALNMDRQSPGAIASRAFWETAYGDHPYAIPPGGTEESLSAISREDILGFHRRYYVRANATLAVVGAISRQEAEQLAHVIDKALPTGEEATPMPTAPMPDEGQVVRIAFRSAQSHIVMGQPGYARGDEAHFPLYVGNHVLGGSGLVSRLGEEMREERGLSYSVSSQFSPMKANGPFMVNTQVRSDRTDEAREVLRENLAELRDTGPDAEELDDAIRNITGSFPLNLDSNNKIVGYVGNIGFHGLPLDYLDTFTRNIEAVTSEAVRTAFAERLDPDRMITVIVGPEEDEAD